MTFSVFSDDKLNGFVIIYSLYNNKMNIIIP